MTTLTAKTTMNSATKNININKKGLWVRFKNYLSENQQTIVAAMAIMNGNSYYAYKQILNK